MADNRGNLRGSARVDNGGGIGGAEDFLKLSKALKAAGQTELRKALNKAMRDAAKPLIPKVRAAARGNLPKKNGLNERMARKPYRVQVRTGEQTAGVRIVGTKLDPRLNNEGRMFHPVFGRKPGVVQTIPGAVGYFDKTLTDNGPAVRDDLANALDDFAGTLIKGL